MSALVIMALLSTSFVLMFLMILDSVCVLCAHGVWLFSLSVLMRSVVSFLYTSHSCGGRCVMAVSASRANVCSQFLGFLCMLYLGPFSRIVVSDAEKCMSVKLTTLLPPGDNTEEQGHTRTRTQVSTMTHYPIQRYSLTNTYT